jgi:hypothetical protein
VREYILGRNYLCSLEQEIPYLMDIFLKNQDLYCESHAGTDRINTKYAWSSPEVGKITTEQGRIPKTSGEISNIREIDD